MNIVDDRDPPIEPLDYTSGVKVVDIGDLRVARGMSRRPYSACKHNRLTYDTQERRIWCQDCETNVEAFDAFAGLVSYFSGAAKKLKNRETRISEAETFQARSLAAKTLDKVWRSRRRVPACPHCRQGLFPEDFKNGCAEMGRDYAEALAAKRKRPT